MGPIRAVRFKDDVLTIQVASAYVYEVLEGEYIDILKSAKFHKKKSKKKWDFTWLYSKKSLSTKNQDIKYNHLITNILHSIKIIYFY